jgi:hypothetical protein
MKVQRPAALMQQPASSGIFLAPFWRLFAFLLGNPSLCLILSSEANPSFLVAILVSYHDRSAVAFDHKKPVCRITVADHKNAPRISRPSLETEQQLAMLRFRDPYRPDAIKPNRSRNFFLKPGHKVRRRLR